MNAHATQLVSTMLEGFFYQEAHALEFCTSLLYEVDDAFSCVTISQEVIDEQYLVAFAQVVTAHTYVV